jgi:segregation and condensation protein A
LGPSQIRDRFVRLVLSEVERIDTVRAQRQPIAAIIAPWPAPSGPVSHTSSICEWPRVYLFVRLPKLAAAMETDYKVKLEIFEGPLDLLLYLIKRDEIDIYEISIERITRQYLEYLQAFKELNLDIAGEFVVMAANLIYLKSRSLLPADQQPPDEEAEEDDPRWDLIRQLIEYKKFKEAAAQLHARALEQERIFTRDGGATTTTADAPLRLAEVGIFQLIHAFQDVIKRVESRENLQEMFGEHFTVSDKIDIILKRVADGASVRFTELFGDIVSRVEIVVTFLALLELIRLKQVRAIQRNVFDEIEIAAA